MPTPTKGTRLGGSPSHERLMMANLATSLFEHGKIKTTETKAKRVRPLAEKLITKAKRGDLHNRRQIMRVIRDKDVVHKLMAEIGPFYEDRNGGYLRITRTMPRKGDNAPMAVVELISEKTVTAEAESARKTKFAKDRPEVAESSADEDGSTEDTGATGQAEQDEEVETVEGEVESSTSATPETEAASAEAPSESETDSSEK